MDSHLPWLSQGDIFSEVPVVVVSLVDGAVQVETVPSPGVLLTHGCAMDKPDKATGLPRVERLQFARLRAVASLSENQQQILRGSPTKVAPFDTMFVGEVGAFGECCIQLTDPFYLPAGLFDLRLHLYPDHPLADSPTVPNTTPTANDTRIGMLEASQVELLHEKMLAYWTRTQSG